MFLTTANVVLICNRKNLLEEDMNHTECTQMMMPTAMLRAHVQNAPIALEMVVFLPT